MILYLHGFRSSPQSFKARLIEQAMAARNQSSQYRCPQLPASPAAAIDLAMSIVSAVPIETLTLIGSSLGGYYATWMAEQIGCRAVLLNPAVEAPDSLQSYVGISTAYHSGQPFEFKADYLDELKSLGVSAITNPTRYFLIAATGDEVLDWRKMQSRFRDARQLIIQGSDHGLSDFAQYLEPVLAFCDGQ